MKRFTLILATCLTAVFIGVGCGQSKDGYAQVNPSKGKAFASASAEAKGTWDKAMASYNTNDYSGAIMTLMSLKAQSGLTAEQTKAVDETMTAISDQMYAAANRGDPAGKKALEDMRKLRGR